MTAPAAYQGFDTMPIAGEWRAGSSGRTSADTDPWNGGTLTEIPLASAGDLDSAFRAASAAQREWAGQPPMWEASSMPHHVTGSIRPSDIPGKESRVYRRPAGVVAVISPWNFPLQLSNRSVAPALATGNAVVLKPASDTPVTGGLLLAKIFEEAGLPPGVLSVVADSGSEIGDALVAHPQAASAASAAPGRWASSPPTTG